MRVRKTKRGWGIDVCIAGKRIRKVIRGDEKDVMKLLSEVDEKRRKNNIEEVRSLLLGIGSKVESNTVEKN